MKAEGSGAVRGLAAQNGAARALAEAAGLDEAVPALLRAVCENLGWSVGELWCPGEAPGSLRRYGRWTDPTTGAAAQSDLDQPTTLESGEGVPGRAAAEGRPVWVTGSGSGGDGGEGTAAAVPVPFEGDRPGVLVFHSPDTVPQDPDALETLAAVGAALGQYVRRRMAERELRASEDRLRFQARLLDTVAEAVIATDLDGVILYWNASAERLYGWGAAEVLGRPIEAVTPALGSRGRATEIMDRLRADEPWSGECLVRDRSGRQFVALVNSSPIHDESGELIGVIGTSIEITARKREEEGQRFLAKAGRVLASSLDYETTLSSVADLAVPTLGDWCLVHGGSGHGRARPVARAVPDDERDAADRFARLLAGNGEGFVAAVLGSDRAVLEPGDGGEGARIRDELDALGIRQLLAVPMRARGLALGIITFAITRSDRRYDGVDARFAEELARRAALALDNARLYRDAQEANRAKADFLAVVSHELRTPLNAIIGYADILGGGIAGELSDGQMKHLERIKVGAGHLAHIIDEVLSYARLESGRDTLRRETTDLGAVTHEAVVVVQPDATDKGLPIHVDLPDPAPTLVTDAGKVRQVLVNLLINAVKYTEEGEVRVRIRPTGDGATIEVSDTGIGIEPGHQERIFEPFWQAESPNTRTIGGTGLGLSVNRRLLELLDGTISVESVVGEGSTFTVWLPKTT